MNHIDDLNTQKANLKYIRTSMRAPMLEKEHELDLAKKWREKGDEKALHELISSYTRLVVAIASKFKHYGLPIGDLIQEGNVGLMMAAERFEYERDIRFSTYATWWIRSSIQDYVLRNWSIVRTGTTAAQKSLFFNMKRLRAQIEDSDGTSYLTEDEKKLISDELNVPIRDVEAMEMRMAANDHSLNAQITHEGGADEWQTLLADERPNPEDVVVGLKDANTRSKWLSEALNELSDRERKIIKQRRLRYEAVTLEELGKELGVSKERVRQLEQRAMDKIKESMLKHVDHHDELFA